MLDLKFLQNWLIEKQEGCHHRQILQLDVTLEQTDLVINQLLNSFEHSLIASDCNELREFATGKTAVLADINHYQALLGNEFDLIIYDARLGINLNSIYAMSGMLVKSGVFVVCVNNKMVSPSGIKLSYASDNTKSLFSELFLNTLQETDIAYIKQKHTFFPSSKISNKDTSLSLTPIHERTRANNTSSKMVLSPQQDVILKKVANTLCDEQAEASVSVILGERGRGKSTLLAHIAAHYCLWHKQQSNGGDKQIAAENALVEVCAAYKQQTKTLINTFANEVSSTRLLAQSDIQFRSPDAIVQSPSPNALLIIDEVASLAPTLLKDIIKLYPKVVLCGTIVGYEGSANGFVQRVLPFLNEKLNVQVCQLDYAIRWYQHDPIESFFKKVLNQANTNKANIKVPPESKAKLSFCTNDICIRFVSKQELINDRGLYKAIFALLSEAHYQTTPNDMVRVLDETRCKLVVAELVLNKVNIEAAGKSKYQDKLILSVATIFEEGSEVLAPLSYEISLSKRRVQGHMSAQALASYIVEPDLAVSNYWRINRIAVDKKFRKQGIGSAVLSFCVQKAKVNNVDVLSTSFGYERELMTFWQNNHFIIAKIGQRIDTSSGSASVMMLYCINNRLKPHLPRLQSKVYADHIYFKTFDKRLSAMFEDLAIERHSPNKETLEKLCEEFCVLHSQDKIAFSAIASVLFLFASKYRSRPSSVALTTSFKRLFEGHLHRHQRVQIESDILQTLAE